jgi:hypothetical protein
MSNKTKNRKLKYSYVRNYTLNAELAQQARDWSWKKIEAELGLEKIDAKPRLNPIPKRVDTYLKRTEKYREYLNENNKIEKYRFAVKQTPTQRKETWTRFSEKDAKDMPKELNTLAEQINIKNGFDPNDSYGFAVVFYSFIQDKRIDEIEELMVKDRFDGDIYLFNKRVR